MAGSNAFEGWAILDLWGGRQRPGYVSEAALCGQPVLQVDIPVSAEKSVVEYYPLRSVFTVKVATEQIVREFVNNGWQDETGLMAVA